MAPLIAAGLFALFSAAGGIWFLRRMADKSEASMRERFPEALLVVRGALFYGQQSKGVKQLRGNGTLVVTSGEIIFERWLPKAEYRIRIADITSVDTPRGFLGKNTGRLLLAVSYSSLTGQSDAMAWDVRDLNAVKSRIESLLH
ncbi:MAG: hypothetical protein IPK52_26845 [Chloroflexi bacterium]|nr:hypothetical protein [Chloroflexota bacterium]